MTVTGVSVIVLTFNGRELLRESLPRTLAALAGSPVPVEVLVVDNGSTDGSDAMLAAEFPAVRVVRLDRNRRFTGGNNAGARAARYSHLLFLNNDMTIEPGFLDSVTDHFANPCLFAVDSRLLDWDRDELQEGAKGVRFADGWFSIVPPPARPPDIPQLTLYATGGGMLVDRAKFLDLGGFDPLFDPFYCEDLDLSYRAWLRGWQVLHDPRLVTRHKLRATNTTRFTEKYRRRADLKNRWLWFWKNVTDRGLLTAHLARTPLILAEQCRDEGVNALRAFGWALRQLPAALAARRRVARAVPDREIERRLAGWVW